MEAFRQGITKEDFLNEITNHQNLDNFVKGVNWESGKGSAVGCSIQSINTLKSIELSHANYLEMENHLGVPAWLAMVEDTIFNGVSAARSKSWPVEFTTAINDGANLDNIKIPFIIFMCEQTREKNIDGASHGYIDGVLSELNKEVLDIGALIVAKNAPKTRSCDSVYICAESILNYDDYEKTATAINISILDSAAIAYANAAYDAAYDAYKAYAANDPSYASTDAAAYNSELGQASEADKESQYTIFADKLLELINNCN